MNTETNDRLNFLVIIWKKLFLMTMHATSPFTNFKEIEGSIFIMKTFSVLTQTMAEVSRGQEGQSSIKRRVTVALVSMLTLQQPSDRDFIPREKIKPANAADGINGCLQIVHRVSL